MLTAAILFTGMASTGQAQVVVGGGAEYATGTYGTGQRIETATASATVRATRKRVSAAVSVPHVRVTGPGNAVPAGGPFGYRYSLIQRARPRASPVAVWAT